MKRSLSVIPPLALLGLVGLAQPAAASDPDTAGLERVFTGMKQALAASKEAPFKALWHPEGYKKNLVGGSGLAGRQVFRQGSKKGWYLKPDMESIRSVPGSMGAPWLIKCDIWSVKKGKAVDQIWALLIYRKAWLMLGGGEKRAQVEALGQRYAARKPLAPKKK